VISLKYLNPILAVSVIVSLSCGVLPSAAVAAEPDGAAQSGDVPSTPAIDAPSTTTVHRAGAHALQVKWSKVPEADGYVVYRASGTSFTKVTTIRRATRLSWVDRGLAQRTTRTYKVRSFADVDGRRVLSRFSYPVSAKTYAKGDRAVNAGGLNVRKTIWAGVLGDAKIRAKMTPARYGNNRHKAPYSKRLRYLVADTSIASVSGKGVITAKKVGSTKVRVLTHNGYRKTVTVHVRSYAHPESFDLSTVRESAVREFLTARKNDLSTVVAYFLDHPVTSEEVVLRLDRTGQLLNPSRVPLGEIEPALMRILGGSPLGVEIFFVPPPTGYITFNVNIGPPDYDRTYEGANRVYYFYGEPSVTEWDKIAPHWFVNDPKDFDGE
jgi:hypothetical protein